MTAVLKENPFEESWDLFKFEPLESGQALGFWATVFCPGGPSGLRRIFGSSATGLT